MLKAIIESHPSLQSIKLRFLVSGHSFLPNDDDFGDIENALKFQQRLYSPTDYIEIMRKCRKKNKLIVTKMEKEDFLGTNSLEKQIVNRKKDVTGNTVSWLKTREIEINRQNPWSIILRQCFDSANGQEVYLKRRNSNRHSAFSNFIYNLEPLWPSGKAISPAKLEDLKSLLYLIPDDSKEFYQNLHAEATIIDDIDGFDGEPDFPLEYDSINPEDK